MDRKEEENEVQVPMLLEKSEEKEKDEKIPVPEEHIKLNKEEQDGTVSFALHLHSTHKEDGTESVPSEHPSSSVKISSLIYGVDDSPPMHLALIFGLQQLFVCLGGIYSTPVAVANQICGELNSALKIKMFSSMLVIVGTNSVLMAGIGTRLPIIQGAASSFLPAIVALMNLKEWQCPENFTLLTQAQQEEESLIRLRELSGALMAASAVQMLIGCFGFIGFTMRFIGPLTIAPSVALIGINLYPVINRMCEKQWGIAMFTIAVALVSTLYIGKRIQLPFPDWSRAAKWRTFRIPIFTVFPIMFGMAAGWTLCGILTAFDVFPEDPSENAYWARTDSKLEFVSSSPWFAVPYPGQMGRPTTSIASFVGMLVAIFAGIIESVGDYYACAKICELPQPPAHAVNRAVLIEGIGCFMSGTMGGGVGVTSYSNEIGALGLTKVACRKLIYTASAVMIICGFLPKFGASINTMPVPVTGGIFCLGMGLVTAVGISNLQYIEMSSSRNLTILGLSMLLGVMLPEYMRTHPEAINTGIREFDQVCKMLLSMGFFVGGVIGFFLDNTVPGNAKERGIIFFSSNVKSYDPRELKTYDLPYITDILGRVSFTKHIPILPQFRRKQLPEQHSFQNNPVTDVEMQEQLDVGNSSSNL